MTQTRTADGGGPGRATATAAGLGAILLWSLSVGLARSLAEQLGPWTAAASVHGVSATLAAVYLARRERRAALAGLPARYRWVGGALFVGYLWVFYGAIGLARTREETLAVGLLNYLWPVLTLWLLPRSGRFRPAMIPATLVALSGLALVAARGGPVPWRALGSGLAAAPVAYALGLAAGVSWALYSALTRRWAGGRGAGAVLLFLPVTALSLAPMALLADEPRTWTARAALETAALGTATFLGYRGWDTAMRRGDAARVAAFSYLTPLLSLAFGSIYLAAPPGRALWLGAALLVAGSLWSWRAAAGGAVSPPGRSRP